MNAIQLIIKAANTHRDSQHCKYKLIFYNYPYLRPNSKYPNDYTVTVEGASKCSI